MSSAQKLEYFRARYREKRGEILTKQKLHYQKNRKRINAERREHYHQNIAQKRADARAYYKKTYQKRKELFSKAARRYMLTKRAKELARIRGRRQYHSEARQRYNMRFDVKQRQSEAALRYRNTEKAKHTKKAWETKNKQHLRDVQNAWRSRNAERNKMSHRHARWRKLFGASSIPMLESLFQIKKEIGIANYNLGAGGSR